MPNRGPSRGIILKKNSPSLSHYLLDAHHGTLLSIIAREDICTGACIEYTLQHKGSHNKVTNVELIAMPYTQTITDLIFFHSALEICQKCMPVSSISPGVFEHLLYFYHDCTAQSLNTAFLKKLFLCKLLILLGFYPHEVKFRNNFFYKLATRPFEYCLSNLALEHTQHELDTWLHSCLALAINTHELKTESIGHIGQ